MRACAHVGPAVDDHHLRPFLQALLAGVPGAWRQANAPTAQSNVRALLNPISSGLRRSSAPKGRRVGVGERGRAARFEVNVGKVCSVVFCLVRIRVSERTEAAHAPTMASGSFNGGTAVARLRTYTVFVIADQKDSIDMAMCLQLALTAAYWLW